MLNKNMDPSNVIGVVSLSCLETDDGHAIASLGSHQNVVKAKTLTLLEKVQNSTQKQIL